MITAYIKDDYAKDPELRKRHSAWLAYEHTQQVLATLEVSARAHVPVTSGISADDKLVILGRLQGMQWIIDTIRSLDAPYRASVSPDESFEVSPTK